MSEVTPVTERDSDTFLGSYYQFVKIKIIQSDPMIFGQLDPDPVHFTLDPQH